MKKICVIFLAIFLLISCRRSNDIVISDFLKYVKEIEFVDTTNPVLQVSDAIDFDYLFEDPNYGYDKLKLKDTTFYLLGDYQLKEDQTFHISLSINPPMDQENTFKICKNTLGTPDGITLYNEPMWKTKIGFISTYKNFIIFQDGNILNFGELYEFPKMPDEAKINQFINSNKLYKFGHESKNIILNLDEVSYLDPSYKGIGGVKLSYTFYSRELNNKKSIDIIQIDIPQRNGNIAFDLLNEKLPQLLPHYDKSIKLDISDIRFEEILEDAHVIENGNIVVILKVNSWTQNVSVNICRRSIYNSLKHLLE